MKTNFFSFALALGLCLAVLTGKSQVSYQTNDPSANPVPLGFLGWNDNTNAILDIRQNNLRRERFRSVVHTTLDGVVYNSASRISYPLQGLNFNPFSMHHLGLSVTTTLRRSWMNVGTTYTDNADIMHVGLYRQPDSTYNANSNVTDAVIAWGDNDSLSKLGPDNLRFIFIKPRSTTINDPAMDDVGKEVARFSSEGNFGIGNFFNNGIYQQPSHRLDVLGTGRFREMSNDTAQVLITGVEQDSIGDYELNYLAFPGNANLFLDGTGNWSPGGGSGGADLDWETDGTNVWTGHGENGFPDGRVGVGLEPILYDAKFTVNDTIQNSDLVTAYTGSITVVHNEATILGTLTGSSSIVSSNIPLSLSVGHYSAARDGKQVVGGWFDAVDNFATGIGTVGSTIGVLGQAYCNNTTTSIGVFGSARRPFVSGGQTPSLIGVYGEALENNTVTQACRAGYFAGLSQQGLPAIQISDESVKQNVIPLQNASEVLNSLNPVSYNYVDHDVLKYLNSEISSMGFIAQEVQEVVPTAVKPFIHPAMYDSLGNQINERLDLLGVDYQQIIPILVAGFKEQRAVIDAQQAELQALQTEIAAVNDTGAATESGATLSDLEAQLASQQEQINLLIEQLAACCAAPIGTPGAGSDKSMNGGATPTDQLHQNIPNPFKEQTTINFELVSDSQVLLEITDAQGNLVATLVNGSMARGQHRVEWNANGQAPGTYYYSLYTDKELLTKKMIKL